MLTAVLSVLAIYSHVTTAVGHVMNRAVRGLLAPLGGAAVYVYDRTVTIVPMITPIMYRMFLVLARSNTSTHGYDLG